jgi:hypothetical protein
MHIHPTVVMEYIREQLSQGRTTSEITDDLHESNDRPFGTPISRQILIHALIESNRAFDFYHYAHG